MPSTKSSKTSRLIIILLLLLLSSSAPPVKAVSYQQWRTLISLSHSLMNRVSELRASRGDYEGSLRARKIAEKLEVGGVGLWGGMWSIGWDYLKNYAWSWRDMASPSDMFGAVSDLNQLLQGLNELTQLKSGKDRTAWVLRNYQNVLVRSKSLVRRLLQVFLKSGPLRDLVLTIQREIEGGLLRDCLELGSTDLNGLIRILKDLALQYSSTNNRGGLGGDL